MVRVGVGQYHCVQVAQATPERVERSQEQLPVPWRAGIDERQAAGLFDQVEVGHYTCEPMDPWGNFGCGGLWRVRHVTFLSCIWRRSAVTRLRSFLLAQPSGRSPSDVRWYAGAEYDPSAITSTTCPATWPGVAVAPAYPPLIGDPPRAAPLDIVTTTPPFGGGVRSACWTKWKACRTSTFQLTLKVSQSCSSSGAITGVAPALRTTAVGL